MPDKEYQDKKRECWEEFKFARRPLNTDKKVFDYIFDRAYALGKLQASCKQVKEVITQGKIEKAAIEYVLTRQQARHNAKKEEDATMRDFDKTIKAWDAYDMEQAFEAGANIFLGRQEKDADTVIVDKEEYDKLCKRSRYIANWVPSFRVCPICGEYNPSGCVCANCNNDKNWNK